MDILTWNTVIGKCPGRTSLPYLLYLRHRHGPCTNHVYTPVQHAFPSPPETSAQDVKLSPCPQPWTFREGLDFELEDCRRINEVTLTLLTEDRGRGCQTGQTACWALTTCLATR